jgi:glycosyltransferase involved in cell wall biosynthesis
MTPRLRLAVVTCYRHPDYVRAIVLRRAARDAGWDVELVRNRSRGVWRYPEVIAQLLRLARQRPDAYLVTFRGYEILPFVLLLAGGRPVHYDEFINPVEWFVEEHRKFRAGGLRARLLRKVFRAWGLRSASILADTASHAAHSAQLSGIPLERYRVVHVGTDEETFRPGGPPRRADGVLRVLYYGSMLPLHGLDIVVEAVRRAGATTRISLLAVGGDAATRRILDDARASGVDIEYRSWVDYAQLPAVFAECDLFLGGPFGGTVQADFVITGKTFQFLACARPVVIGANHESQVFTDRVDAIIVPQRDTSALADAFVWAAAHPTELAGIAAAGRELYLARYAAAPVAAEVVAAIPLVART